LQIFVDILPSTSSKNLPDHDMVNATLMGELVPVSPKFSVVVIAYNSDAFLLETVESALSQDLRDVEVIVVDDGSRQPVSETLPSAVLARCVVIRKENGGIAAARNTGIRACRSPYVSLLDGDDCMLPHHCRLALACFESSPEVEVVVPDAYIIADGVARRTVAHSARYPRASPITFDSYLNGSSPLAGWSTMRRDCFDRFGFLDEEFRNGGEDFHHFSKLLAAGAKFIYLQEPTYEYRRHDGSITFSRPMHMAKCILRALDKLVTEPAFNSDMLRMLDEYRLRTTQLLAWYEFRESFAKRDFEAAAKLLPSIRARFLPSTASRVKFFCAAAVLLVLLRTRR
jgi:glycosyltransferase involved in cell wall biosynthesis